MNRFLYYLPGAAGANAETLAEIGLEARFRGIGGVVRHGVTQWQLGPDGRNGCVVGMGTEFPVYDAEKQVWREFEGFWIGYERGFKPGPADLIREMGHAGFTILLLDNQEWCVPRVKRWDAARFEFVVALPAALTPVKGGMRISVLAEFEGLDRIGDGLVQAIEQAEAWTVQQLYVTAARLLGANYRIGAEEIGLLGLFDEALAIQAGKLAIDVPSMVACGETLAVQGLEVQDSRFKIQDLKIHD